MTNAQACINVAGPYVWNLMWGSDTLRRHSDPSKVSVDSWILNCKLTHSPWSQPCEPHGLLGHTKDHHQSRSLAGANPTPIMQRHYGPGCLRSGSFNHGCRMKVKNNYYLTTCTGANTLVSTITAISPATAACYSSYAYSCSNSYPRYCSCSG